MSVSNQALKDACAHAFECGRDSAKPDAPSARAAVTGCVGTGDAVTNLFDYVLCDKGSPRTPFDCSAAEVMQAVAEDRSREAPGYTVGRNVVLDRYELRGPGGTFLAKSCAKCALIEASWDHYDAADAVREGVEHGE